MKWSTKDLGMYAQAKEFIDTALIPLLPFSFGENMLETGSSNEYITILSLEIEKQMKGRMLLMPTFHYLGNDEDKLSRIKQWAKELEGNHFKHVFYLTSDMEWKKHEKDLEHHLIWLPAILLESLDHDRARDVIAQQVRQILDIFTFYWNG